MNMHIKGIFSLFQMAGPIKETLSRLFPSENGVKVISEPGRYFVEGALSLAMCVIGKRQTEQETIVSSPGKPLKGTQHTAQWSYKSNIFKVK